jgi:hypothetical protein
VVKSLAYGKPILARSIPTTCVIKEKLGGDENLILYSSTEELLQRLRQGFPQWKNGSGTHGDAGCGWDAVTEQIGHFLCQVSRSVFFREVLVPRLQQIRLLAEKEHLQGRARAAPSTAGPAGATIGEALAASGELSAALRAREAAIQAIYDSWSWRLTAPMRRLADVYLGWSRWKTRRNYEKNGHS